VPVGGLHGEVTRNLAPLGRVRVVFSEVRHYSLASQPYGLFLAIESTSACRFWAMSLLWLCIWPTTSAAQVPLGGARSLLVRGATIVSPERSEAMSPATVWIVGNRIKWIGDEGASDAPRATDTLDATGMYLVPGLIDSHVHVSHLPGFTDEQREVRPDLVDAYFAQLPASYLYFGFTTLVDLDLSDATRAKFASARYAPTLYGCRGVRYFEGYGPSLFPEEIRYKIFPTWIFDESQRDELPGSADPLQHTPEVLLPELVASGARCIKTYHEPGFGGVFDWPTPSDGLLRRVTQSAHSHGLPVALHATGIDSYAAGVDAGVDILAHGVWHWPGSLLNPTPPDVVATLLRRVRDAGIAVQPTARVVLGEKGSYTWETLNDPEIRNVLPADLREWYASDEGRSAQRDLAALYERVLGDPATAHPVAHLDALGERVLRVLKDMAEADVSLLFGSDTPASDGVGNPPGLNGYLEIQAWESAGVSANRILESLTLANARAFGLDDEIGSVEVGKRADLLLLADDPQHSATAYNSIRWIILGGVPLPRETLSAASDCPAAVSGAGAPESPC